MIIPIAVITLYAVAIYYYFIKVIRPLAQLSIIMLEIMGEEE